MLSNELLEIILVISVKFFSFLPNHDKNLISATAAFVLVERAFPGDGSGFYG